MTDPATGFSIPDFETGFIDNGLGRPNSWRTSIQSVLSVEDNGTTDIYYLSHECRNENVPFSTECESDVIFKRDKPYEFLTYTHEDRFYQIPCLDTVTSRVSIGKIPGIKVDQYSHLFMAVRDDDWFSKVHCPWISGTPEMSFGEVYEGLTTGTLHPNKLVLDITFRTGNKIQSIYAPCKYVNIATPGKESRAYLQPISGTCIYHNDGIGIIAGYIAVALSEDGDISAEFCTTRVVDLEFMIQSLKDLPDEMMKLLARIEPISGLMAPVKDYVLSPEIVSLRFFEIKA